MASVLSAHLVRWSHIATVSSHRPTCQVAVYPYLSRLSRRHSGPTKRLRLHSPCVMLLSFSPSPICQIVTQPANRVRPFDVVAIEPSNLTPCQASSFQTLLLDVILCSLWLEHCLLFFHPCRRHCLRQHVGHHVL